MLDLQASEVLDYAVRMSGAPSHLSGSMEYQLARLQYAATQVSFGCNANAAFRYCMDIMVAMWQQLMSMPPNRLTQLADMADRLHYLASATPDELVWIAGLKAMAVSQLTASHFHQPQETIQSTAIDPDTVIPPVHGQETLVNTSGQPLNEGSQTLSMVSAPLSSNYEGNNVFEQKNVQMESTMQAANRSRQTSLSEEANQWHQNHQDPINMSQQISTAMAHNRRMSIESTGGTPTTTKKVQLGDDDCPI